MTQDAQGHHLSGATAEAAGAYDEGARAFNLVHGDAIGLFDTALGTPLLSSPWRIWERPGCWR